MGAKTALLAFAEGDIGPALAGATRPDRTEVESLVRRLFAGYDLIAEEEGTLSHGVYPPDDVTYATALAGVDLVCDRRLVFDRPSELPAHLHQVAGGRRIVMHAMHSVVDWLAFAVWQDGVLVRSLSLSPDGGITENIGEPYEFERPYWAGEHAVEPIPGWPDEGPYPLPFHPLDLGEEALRALFGFVIEGYPHPDDVDAEAVAMLSFRVTDPSGRERAAREEAYARDRREMGPPRFFRMGPEGTMHEIDFPEP
jgi:hypothetical protein